jgi:hypothetical protein
MKKKNIFLYYFFQKFNFENQKLIIPFYNVLGLIPLLQCVINILGYEKYINIKIKNYYFYFIIGKNEISIL